MAHYQKELRYAISIVRNASKITEWFQKKGFNSYLKNDNSPVTLADFASQIYIIAKLKQYFPNDEIIAEEENSEFIDHNAINLITKCLESLDLAKEIDITQSIGYRGISAERKWTIDPIDGTIGYQKGFPYAIGIGLIENLIPKICAIAVPNYNKKGLAIFSAEKGCGAQVSYNNGKSQFIKVSNQNNLINANFCHSLHYDKPWVEEFIKIARLKNVIQIDSMAKFCMVADGSVDLYIKPLDADRSFIWDFMPGDLIVREAGGQVTDLNGDRLKFKENKCIWTSPGIVSSNGILQAQVLELIKNRNLGLQ